MNENDFDLAAQDWLQDGPNRMSDGAVLATLDAIHATRQRRTMRPAWKATAGFPVARLAVAAVLVIAVGALAINVVSRQSDRSNVGGPSPSATQSTDFPKLTTTFVSPRNGFSVKVPDRVSLVPATTLFGVGEGGSDVVETGQGDVFKGASTPMPTADYTFLMGEAPGVTVDEWIDTVVEGKQACRTPRSQQADVTIDGQLGRIAECPGEIDATVVSGQRLYLFRLLHERADARAVFDDFAATIALTPKTAVDIPALSTTFTSRTNRLSFGYLDRRGALAPATELWDPVTQPLPDDSGRHDGPFDGVETGLAAYFKAASTAIPDGVSIDAWVDEYVPSACGIPRNRQAPITIDGQPGRISECPNRIEATVSAGGRLYLFILLHDRNDALAFFDAWVATIQLIPEDAAAPSVPPSS